MEWQFRINWQSLVEEAKQRRKKLNLTQAKLAALAGVSTPTLSRFENGQDDIQLFSVLNILKILGMVDQRTLIFPKPEPHYDKSRQAVSFSGIDGNKTIPCAISMEALTDHFENHNKNLLKVFLANIDRIEHEARRKYLSGMLEKNGSILIKSEDIDNS